MAINKVVFGDTPIMDISDSTVTADKLAKGVTAYNKAGNMITGTMEAGGSSSGDSSGDSIVFLEFEHSDFQTVIQSSVEPFWAAIDVRYPNNKALGLRAWNDVYYITKLEETSDTSWDIYAVGNNSIYSGSLSIEKNTDGTYDVYCNLDIDYIEYNFMPRENPGKIIAFLYFTDETFTTPDPDTSQVFLNYFGNNLIVHGLVGFQYRFWDFDSDVETNKTRNIIFFRQELIATGTKEVDGELLDTYTYELYGRESNQRVRAKVTMTSTWNQETFGNDYTIEDVEVSFEADVIHWLEIDGTPERFDGFVAYNEDFIENGLNADGGISGLHFSDGTRILLTTVEVTSDASWNVSGFGGNGKFLQTEISVETDAETGDKMIVIEERNLREIALVPKEEEEIQYVLTIPENVTQITLQDSDDDFYPWFFVWSCIRGGEPNTKISNIVKSGESYPIDEINGTYDENTDVASFSCSGFKTGKRILVNGQIKLVVDEDTGDSIETVTLTKVAVGELPPVSAANDGNVLRVVNGVWTAAALPSAAGVNF